MRMACRSDVLHDRIYPVMEYIHRNLSFRTPEKRNNLVGQANSI
jgi:hypothetical protein